jgi:hypothetical protein
MVAIDKPKRLAACELVKNSAVSGSRVSVSIDMCVGSLGCIGRSVMNDPQAKPLARLGDFFNFSNYCLARFCLDALKHQNQFWYSVRFSRKTIP